MKMMRNYDDDEKLWNDQKSKPPGAKEAWVTFSEAFPDLQTITIIILIQLSSLKVPEQIRKPLMAWVDIDAKRGRAKKKPEAWSKGSPGENQADHQHHNYDHDHHHKYDDQHHHNHVDCCCREMKMVDVETSTIVIMFRNHQSPINMILIVDVWKLRCWWQCWWWC